MKQCAVVLWLIFAGSLGAGETTICPAVISTERSTLAKASIPKGSLGEAVCKIAVGDSGGSGTNIDPKGKVLTCAHVVGVVLNQPVELMFPGHEQIIGHLTFANRETDLAIIEFDNSKAQVKHIPLAEDRPSPGDDVTVMGYPVDGNQQKFVTRTGKLQDTTTGRNSRTGPLVYWLLGNNDCWIRSGDSGGCVVNGAGQLVGVLSRNKAQEGDYRFRAIDIAEIYEICGLIGRFRRAECPQCPGGVCPGPNYNPPVTPSVIPPKQPDPVPGPSGKDGAQGPPGPPGKDADPAALAALKAQVAALEALASKPLVCRLYDVDGKLLQEVQFMAGKPLILRLVPLQPAKASP